MCVMCFLIWMQSGRINGEKGGIGTRLNKGACAKRQEKPAPIKREKTRSLRQSTESSAEVQLVHGKDKGKKTRCSKGKNPRREWPWSGVTKRRKQSQRGREGGLPFLSLKNRGCIREGPQITGHRQSVRWEYLPESVALRGAVNFGEDVQRNGEKLGAVRKR